MYKKYLKRIFDLCFSICVLIITLPLLVIVSIIIKIESNGPVIFKQERLGIGGKKFAIYKFRTMCVGAEKQGVYESENDIRVTKFGKILRKTSIDELPQLINIIKGDMSVIGPRPTLTYHPWQYNQYTNVQLIRFNVKPGVTGWAQINGRKEVEWNERIKLDVFYVENISIKLDILIFLKTIVKVIKMENNINKSKTA